MRVAAIVIAAICLTGCFSDQQRQFHQCRLDAMKLYSNDEGGPWSRASQYVYDCMEAAGYTLKVSSQGKVQMCQFGARERILLEECYVPTGRVARWIHNAEMWLTGDD